MMEQLKSDVLPADWLHDSSRTLSEIFAAGNGAMPPWCRPVTWLDYAEKRYDRVRNQLRDLLRPAAFVRKDGDRDQGWTLEQDRVVIWEPQDVFGRRGFNWDNVAFHPDQHGCGQWRPDSAVQKECGGFPGMSPPAARAMAPLSAYLTLGVRPGHRLKGIPAGIPDCGQASASLRSFSPTCQADRCQGERSLREGRSVRHLPSRGYP